MEVKISEEMKQSANRNMRNHLRDKNSLTETTECIICDGKSSDNEA